MKDNLKDIPQIIDRMNADIGTILYIKGIDIECLKPYRITEEMYDRNKQYHLVELTLQSDLGETFEWEIVYRLLLYIRSAYDSGSLLRYTCHDGRVLSIKAVTEPKGNRRAYITVAYLPNGRDSYAELVTSCTGEGLDTDKEAGEKV